MWVVSQSGELVNIAEARWLDCVPDRTLRPGDEVGAGTSWPRWKVRVFYSGNERGPYENNLFRGPEAEARAVLRGIILLTAAYSLKRTQAYGAQAVLSEDLDLEGGRVIPLEEPVLTGFRTAIK